MLCGRECRSWGQCGFTSPPSAPFSYLENLLNLLSVSFTICKRRKIAPTPAAPEDHHKAEIMHMTSLGQTLHPSLSI